MHALCCVRRAPVLATATTDGFEHRLLQLLHWLQFWRPADDVAPASAPHGADATRWWQLHRTGARDAVRELDSAVRAGDLEAAADRLAVMNLDWLRPPRPSRAPSRTPSRTPSSSELAGQELERGVSRAAAFLAEALTPWDFDRREPALTFVTSWSDDMRAESGGASLGAVVKVASIVKPLSGEWKLTGRTRLFGLGERGAVIGKAGVYLAGGGRPYVGVEVDRVVALLEGTGLFVNANYRSSRVPYGAPVVASAGVQHTVVLAERIDVTFRIGVSTRRAECPWFFTPMPKTSYF